MQLRHPFLEIILRYRILEILQILFIAVVGVIYSSMGLVSLQGLMWLVALFFQISCAYSLNDFFDWDHDFSNRRKRAPLPKPYLRAAILLTAIISLLIGWSCGLRPFFYLVTSHAAALLYSVPPFRWKAVTGAPLPGHFFMGAVYSFSSSTLSSHSVRPLDVLLALFWGLVLASASLGNEIVDREADRHAGISTLGNSLSAGQASLLLCGLQSLALLGLLVLTVTNGLTAVSYIVAAGFVLYLVASFVHRPKMDALKFRLFYRLLFSVLILSFIFGQS